MSSLTRYVHHHRNHPISRLLCCSSLTTASSPISPSTSSPWPLSSPRGEQPPLHHLSLQVLSLLELFPKLPVTAWLLACTFLPLSPLLSFISSSLLQSSAPLPSPQITTLYPVLRPSLVLQTSLSFLEHHPLSTSPTPLLSLLAPHILLSSQLSCISITLLHTSPSPTSLPLSSPPLIVF